MDKNSLVWRNIVTKLAFGDLAMIALQTEWDAMSYFIKSALQEPHRYQELIDEIAGGEDGSYRLNGAGLKIYYSSDECDRPHLHVGGDQSGMYPQFVAKANARLRELKFQE
ncbi:MAG: hypothetical protein A2W25_11655 [candidate division Zixibacteria bacterium RBG_16_53_22]|nr:MAG: hypothetical protein A2W25_11655 [candidate division Zixibacteria bacterium RBG_16_53_22]